MHYFSLIIFTMVLCITPGPNNIMVMASGLNFRHNVVYPQILGTTVGSFLLCISIGVFLKGLFVAYPISRSLLEIGACIYLIWLAWKFGRMGFKKHCMSSERPISFIQALSFQVINPKVWAVAATMLSVYVYRSNDGQKFFDILIATTIFSFSVFLTKIVWLYCGVYIKKYLISPFYQRIFNMVTAGTLVLTVVFIVLS